MRVLSTAMAVVFLTASAYSAGSTVTSSAVEPGNMTSPPQAGARTDQQIRFAEMDRNGDGVITRQEWRGSQRSFEVHDWNGDGRLSGNEVRQGASWPNRGQSQSTAFWDWSEQQFRQLDRNADSRVSRAEWGRFDVEDFLRVDQNGDNVLTLREFMFGEVDDDRGDRFEYLDLNNNNRLDRSEWHGGEAAFRWLDRNADGQLSRMEVAGTDLGSTPGRQSGALEPARTIAVTGRQAWLDTRVELRAGDYLYISTTGRVQWAPGNNVDANGTPSAGGNAPLPGAGAGALIGRIGNGQAFLVGVNLDGYRVPTGGRLYLMVNDDMLTDNTGQFRASISVERRR